MIYKPQNGQIKDDAMFYHEGKFYLFSMYHKADSDVYNNIWLVLLNPLTFQCLFLNAI